MRVVRIWDLPTRLFHWVLAVCVISLIVTGSIGGNAMIWHFRLGYAVASLLLFRLIWGLVGGHWSRFSSFMYSPSVLMAYLRGKDPRQHAAGHNPLGALSVFALLATLMVQVGTGLISDDEIAATGPLAHFVSAETVSWATAYHADVGKLILIFLVSLHVAAIVYYAAFRKDNLVRPMLMGDMAVDLPENRPLPSSRDDTWARLLAFLLLGLCSGTVIWLISLGG